MKEKVRAMSCDLSIEHCVKYNRHAMDRDFFSRIICSLIVIVITNGIHIPASSTTEFRPSRSSTDPSQWSVDDVARYLAEADPALTPYSDLFRKHVCR